MSEPRHERPMLTARCSLATAAMVRCVLGDRSTRTTTMHSALCRRQRAVGERIAAIRAVQRLKHGQQTCGGQTFWENGMLANA